MNELHTQDLIGKDLDGDLTITGSLGHGGMGSVYRGYQPSLNRDVCVKFMLPELVSSFEFFKRFQREAKVLASLHHPNVIEVFSFGLFEGTYPYLVMEFVNGDSLRQLLHAESGIAPCVSSPRSRLEWKKACTIIIQVCEGLSAVHENGFIHRDLKPDNILLTEAQGTERTVKIIDFGLTGFTQRSTVTETGDMLGSVHYMAPECYTTAQHNVAVDVYSVGCILFECLTGKPPFDASSMAAVSYMHVNEPLPALPASLATVEIRQYLQSIFERCCAKNPTDRFRNCDEIAVLLRNVLTEETGQTALQALLKPASAATSKTSNRTCILVCCASIVLLTACVTWHEWSGKVTYAIALLSLQQHKLSNDYDGLLNSSRSAHLNRQYQTCRLYCQEIMDRLNTSARGGWLA